MENFDVVIVGAGLSGIGMAAHLKMRLPGKSYTILEARGAIGGTWDLFRYPGIRSDSDMHTLGYRFKPWRGAKAIADGPSIRDYVTETAREYGIDKHIRFGQAVASADWSSQDALWTVMTKDGGSLSARFLVLCSGYYDYADGYRPHWEGEDTFTGQIVHPQHWPEGLDYTNKRVVVIGSGATAVTLVPELARDAAHVTMLQRSPTYVVSRPAADAVSDRLRRLLPEKVAYALTRWKNVLWGQFFYRLTQKRPEKMKARLIGMVRDHLGPDYDVERHFTPSYNPWDQRLCLVPDADLFDAIKAGTASVVTDTIANFTSKGIQLASGDALDADIVVTATGLRLNTLGDVAISVDGRRVDPAKSLIYKGMMLGDVPNIAFTFGYTNASWTLKADLTSEYLCRLIDTMDRRGAVVAMPKRDPGVGEEPFFGGFSSGYVQRGSAMLPKQGDRAPWKLHQNYARDLIALRFGKVDDGTMTFRGKAAAERAA